MQSEDTDLLHGDPEHWAAFLGVSRRQINNYKSGKTPLPDAQRRLLRLRRDGDLAALLGDAWEGFSFGLDGLLYVPGWHNGMRPEQVRAMFFVNQEAAALRSEVRSLRQNAGALQALGDLVRLPPANDRYCTDHAHSDVLGAGHGLLLQKAPGAL